MKHPLLFSVPVSIPDRPGHRAGRDGYALVLVLFVVVLCVLMAVILMERNSSSMKSASAYSQAARVRSLSDMAVHLVQAQIRDATTTNQMPTTSPAIRDMWASQPGAIRVFKGDGTLRNIYKLYSSDTMQTSSANLTGDVPPNWFSRKPEYTDINDPVRQGGKELYPVMNPDAAALNPGAAGITDGFKITSAPVQTGVAKPNTAPMPVRWIYVLEDGTLCQLGDARINKTTNPIVGRIAFWTDDETSKVNLNTASPASANSFWDVPRSYVSTVYNTSNTREEGKLALYQPSQNEYNRYPGHPAMVSLRPILGSLGGMSSADYFKLVPRYRWGGSKEATEDIGNPTSTRTPLLTNKEDRLYATVDELLFQSSPATQRVSPSPAQIESLRFFLTTSSRAPELNLFGQPRVTIWPLSSTDDTLHRTPFDSLIAFCSTLGGKAYYFVRNNPLSPTADYTSFARNRELYAYLQRLTSTPVPGFGGNFLTKYGPDRDQILTEIFDYIRVTNLTETYSGLPPGYVSYTRAPEATGSERYIAGAPGPQWFSATDLSKGKGAGFVVPIAIGDTRGGGRFPAVTGAGLWIIRHLEDPKIPPDPQTNREKLSALLLVKTCTPMHGYMPWIASDLSFEIVNPTVEVTLGNATTPLFSGGSTDEIYWAPNVYDARGAIAGGYDGCLWPLGVDYNNSTRPGSPFITPLSAATFVGNNTSFSIGSGTVEIQMKVAGQTIQTYKATFPAATGLPLPAMQTPTDGNGTGTYPWWNWRLSSGKNGNYISPYPGEVLKSIELSHGDARLALMTETSPAAPFTDYTPHAKYADPTPNVGHSMRGWGTKPYNFLGGSTGTYVPLSYPVDTNGGAGYGPQKMILEGTPDIPSGITDLRAEGWSGDFDNGIATFADGPFLNKPDEGSTIQVAGQIPYSALFWKAADGFFSPLRQVPSAVMFGSLPTGVKDGTPWRTLLFCPNPADPGHIGFSSPADHLLLDLFRMPVVEPLALSSPASTDGKINMNYAIAPFSYIRRASSWYALFETLKFMAIPDAASTKYKQPGLGYTLPMRFSANITETLKQFDTRFAGNDIFRSPSEMCSLFLVPQGSTLASVKDLVGGFWATRRLTGDNTREKPYAELYPKLTTQSNSYRVHLRVQVLPRSDGPPTGKPDFVPLAEFRGSRLIERYLDPENPRFAAKGGTVDPDTDNLNDLYQFRILEARQFNP